MGEPIYYGVRHLSPGAAKDLLRALEQAQPELVLVEGPSDLNDQIQWLCHPRTRFPVAILAYTDKPPLQTILYPLAIYSPEVQAIRWAASHQIPCRFMDLPSEVFLGLQKEETGPSATDSVYDALEILTGEPHDAFWERTFEQCDDYHYACNTFGQQLREAQASETQENNLREAHMKRMIDDAIREGIAPEKIFCVCGAYHVSGLKSAAPMTPAARKKLPAVPAKATLMPYSYYRLSRRSGYGAGNQAPGYFHLVWDCLNHGGYETVGETYLVSLANAHRQAGNMVSPAEVIEALRLSRVLASIRGSRYPVLRDLQDAAITTMGHGQYGELATAFATVEIGSTIGYLPEGVSRTSVQEDFYRQLKALKLDRFRTHTLQRLDLDLREKLTVKSRDSALLDLRRSFFLHRLRVTGVHFATELRSRQQSANWGEYWELRWTPETEIEIVESSLLGDTIEGAAAYALKERAEQAVSIDQAAAVFRDAFLCGIPESASHALTVLQSISVDTAALTQIAATAQELSAVVRYGDLRQYDPAPLIPLIRQLYLRACLTMEDACICDNNAAGQITQAMEQLNLLTLYHDFLDPAQWNTLLERIAHRDDLNTRCSGFAMAIGLERGLTSEDQLSREVSRRLSPGISAELGAGWFEGLAARNRYALITRLSLWRQLSDYLDGLDEQDFRRGLVFLRRAFSEFTPDQKNDIAENLAEIWGVSPAQTAELLMQELTEAEASALSDLDDFDFDDI